MTEEETKPEGEGTPEEKPEGGETSSDLINTAARERKLMKKENDRREKILDREEEILARKELGGTAEAGKEKEKPKEETDSEYADRIMRNG